MPHTSTTSGSTFTSLAPENIVGATCRNIAGLGSEIRRMFLLGEEQRKQHPERTLIDLSLGNPDLEPPEKVLEELARLVADRSAGTHRYMDNAGFADIRAFVAARMAESQDVPLGADNVFLTCGAAGGIQILMRVLLDPGSEVVLFAPYFSEYVPYTVNMQATPVVVGSGADHLPSPEAFAASLTEKTRLVILNSPNNPTGVIYPRELCEALFEVLREHRRRTGRVVHVLSDEPYANLVYGAATFPALLPLYDALWIVRSHSKDLGLAGERIGYLVWGNALASADTLGSLRNAARAMGFVNAPALMQRLLPHVFSARVDIGTYEKRVRAFTRILREGGVPCVEPGGSFFVFPSAPDADDRNFAAVLLEKGVLVVPGSGFGKPGYVRCSLTRPQAEVEQAARLYVEAFHAAH